MFGTPIIQNPWLSQNNLQLLYGNIIQVITQF